jgi:hypothetical protein
VASIDEDWARLRAAATTTRLNSSTTSGGDDLAVPDASLTDVGGQADFLATELDAGGHAAEDDTRAAGDALRQAGLGTGAALADVAERWSSQATALRDDCRRIASHLTETVRTHAGGEQEIIADLRSAHGGTGWSTGREL